MVKQMKPKGVSDFITDMEDELQIDENLLEDELKKQPELRNDVGKELAYAVSRRDQAKHSLKEAEAMCAKEYRDTARREQEKVTEKEIENAVILDEQVNKAKRDLVKAELEVNLLEALRDSFKDRGYALGRLVDLWLERYYDRDGARGSENDLRNARATRVQETLKKQYREERQTRRKEPPF
jgi:hypothetical protein